MQPGKIYLSGDRGCVETAAMQSMAVFNFQSFFNEHKQPSGRLLMFNDNLLRGASYADFCPEESCYLLLIPITGALIFETSGGSPIEVNTEEILLVNMPAGYNCRISNPYQTELINFLQIAVLAPLPIAEAKTRLYQFDLPYSKNSLVKTILDKSLPFSVSIGMLGGRSEVIYTLPPENSLFAFSVKGAFEIEGRLLHERDSLALWNTAEMEAEALSNDAILLIFELQGFKPDSN